MADVWLIVLLVAACEAAAGYLAGDATLFEGWRGAADDRQAAAWDRYGDDRWALAAAKWWELITCRVCFGWHAGWVACVWLAAVVDVQLGHWGWWPPVWAAASAIHTESSRLLGRLLFRPSKGKDTPS